MIAPPWIVVIAGVSGSGKSTVGIELAERLNYPFEEGDSLHPRANLEKMKSGLPLSDEDRRPWLDAVAAWIADQGLAGGGGVISCSALRRAYRDRLRQTRAAGLRFVLLDPPVAVLRDRLAGRRSHFMPPALLDSQLATLERPIPVEHSLVLTNDVDPMETSADIVHWLEIGR